MPVDDVKRPHYSEGQYLRPADFVAEQEYHRDAQRRTNLGHHTWGIFSGLELVEKPRDGAQGKVDLFVQPGFAVDGFGRAIEVFAPYKLDASILNQQSGTGWTSIWIRYATELTDPPPPGYEACASPNLATRTHEIFCVEAGTFTAWHDDVTYAGRDTPDSGLVPDLSVPAQALPQDEEKARWRIRLGSVNWDGADFVAAQNDQDRARYFESRAYGGVIADKLLAQGASIRISSRPVPPPLAAGQAGVTATLEGSLVVDRTASVGTADVMAPLTIRASTSAQDPAEETIGLEDAGGAASWLIQQNPSSRRGLAIMEAQAQPNPPAPRLFVRKGGNVGVGTLTPDRPLAVRAAMQSQELVSFEDPSGTVRWHLNQMLYGTKAGLNFVETGVADGRLFLAVGGNVGVGTVDPRTKLDVAGDVTWGGNSILQSDQGGSIELGGSDSTPGVGTPYIDFHYNGKKEDFNTRIINDGDGVLSLKATRAAASGDLTVAGLVGVAGWPAAPATPGWGGGVHTWDLEAEGTVWSKNGYELGSGAGRVKVPVDVFAADTVLGFFGPVSGTTSFTLTSRLPSVSGALFMIAPSAFTAGVFGTGQIGVAVDHVARVNQNSFSFVYQYSVPAFATLQRVAYVVVFTP
jgi:hypothetical protein